MRLVFLTAVLACAAVAAPAGPWHLISGETAQAIGGFVGETRSAPPAPKQAVFFGDVLLARVVERQMREHGVGYPFAGFPLASSTLAVVNFESAVPVEHAPTPPFSVRFSTDSAFLTALTENGITHAGLANNHSFDFGNQGFSHTRSALVNAGITPFGHPRELSPVSMSYLNLAGGRVSVVGINALAGDPTPRDLAATFDLASATSDVQVAYVHWGSEYEVTHTRTQRDLAEQLVAAGADLIIGHHPHVVQDIEPIDGVPVVYSLGNHIFDQYFSTDVQQGLVVKLTLVPSPTLSLVPVTSTATPGQPHPLVGAARVRALEALAARSAPALRPSIITGALPLPQLLASSP